METGITKWSEIAERIPGRLGKQVSGNGGESYYSSIAQTDGLPPSYSVENDG